MKRYYLTYSKQTKSRTPIYIGLIVIVLLIFQVIVSNRLANAGVEIYSIDSEISQIQIENSFMREKIASDSSLLSLSNKAKDYGFVKPITPIFLAQELPIALQVR